MAYLYRRTYKVDDPETGETVKRPYKKWYIRYRDEDGRLRRVQAYTDRVASLQKAAELERLVELRQSGVRDPYADHRATPLKSHLKEFRATLLSRGGTERHVKETYRQAKRLIEECGFRVVGDLSPSRVERFLGDLRVKGRSARTRNCYLQSIRQFSKWLVSDRRMPDDPLVSLKRANEQADKRRQRRALSTDEFAKLLESASGGPIIEGVTGPDRAMIYLLSAFTGLRRKEIGSLKRVSFDFDADNPTVTVEASFSKRRRRDTLPLHPALVDRLRTWLDASDIGNGKLLFPIADRKTAKMMKEDLERVGVPYVDEQGRVADFHANRHTFITNLCRAGVAPKVAQSLARHSTITLTMDVYAHADQGEQVAAVRSLPAPKSLSDAQSNSCLNS